MNMTDMRKTIKGISFSVNAHFMSLADSWTDTHVNTLKRNFLSDRNYEQT